MSDLLQINGSVFSPRKFKKSDKRKEFILVQKVTLTAIEDKATASRGDDMVYKFTGSEVQILDGKEGETYMERLNAQQRAREEEESGQSGMLDRDEEGNEVPKPIPIGKNKDDDPKD